MGKLILNRRRFDRIIFEVSEAIPIGTRFSIEVMSLVRDRVFLEIDAPMSISVNREEIQEIIDEETIACLDRAENSDCSAIRGSHQD